MMSAAEPLTPSLVAVIVSAPAANAVTVPSELIDAPVEGVFDHATLRPVRTFPEASRSVAVAAVVPPATIDDVPSATDTEATGTGGGGCVVGVQPIGC